MNKFTNPDTKASSEANENNRLGFYSVLNDFNLDEMLGKYGPEGCFILASALNEAAQDDMDRAMEFSDLELHSLLRDAQARFGIPCFGDNKNHLTNGEADPQETDGLPLR